MRDETLYVGIGVLWIGGALLMIVHTVGTLASWWSITGPTWWAALSFLVAMSVASMYACWVDYQEPRPKHRSRVYNGQITRGFDKWRRRRAVRGDSDAVSVEHVTRMHRFGSGYEDRGRPRKLTMDLTESDARAVRDLLDDWLAEREGERDEKGGS